MNIKVVFCQIISILLICGSLVACQTELKSIADLEPHPRVTTEPSETTPSSSGTPHQTPPPSTQTPVPSSTATSTIFATAIASSTAMARNTRTATATAMPTEEAPEQAAFAIIGYDGDSIAEDQTADFTPPAKQLDERELDVQGIIDWQRLELPVTFRAIYPEGFGVEKGATAIEFFDSTGEGTSVPIESSFVFMDDAETTFIFGYSFFLEDPNFRRVFISGPPGDNFIGDQNPSSYGLDIPEIGDESGGKSELLSDEERIDTINFLIEDVAASVNIRYPEGQAPQVDIINLAQVYADSLLDPQPRCQIVSATPVEDSLWPSFDIEAIGFFPREQRIIELYGYVQKGEETLTASSLMAGQTGETSDQEGRVIENINFLEVAKKEEGISPISNKMTLTVTGGFSGCQATQTVTWIVPEPLPELAGSSPVNGETIQEHSPPDGILGYIAFARQSEEEQGIYFLDLQTGKVGNLTKSPANDFMPKWSPDGDSLMFSTRADGVGDEIYLLYSDGSFTRLTNNFINDFHGVWSSDGKEIAFTAVESEKPDIFTMDLTTGDVIRLTDDPGVDWFPNWSPDGQHIVFESDRDGNFELYKMNRDGSEIVRLTDNEAIDTSPAWSPDGQKIAFDSSRSGWFQVHLLDLASGEVTQLTESKTDARHAAWSPDGRYIAYDTYDEDDLAHIFIMKADGSDQQQVTFGPDNENYPSWTGHKEVFEKARYWHQPVCALDTDGDFEADTITQTWPPGEEMYFAFLLFRNMEDGMNWSHTWKNLNTGMTSEIDAVWDGGETGGKAIFATIPADEPVVWEIEFRLEGELLRTLQCPVIES